MLPMISVLGVSGYHKTDTLKYRVEEALRELGVSISVAEVTDLEEMVASRIAAIPALVVNDHVLVQGEIPETEELKEQLARYIFKWIVVPVDFSEASLNALRYAQALATAFSMSVKVLHVYGPIPTLPDGGAVMETASEWLDSLHEDMKSFIDPDSQAGTRRLMPGFPHLDYEIRSGNIEAELRRESRKPDNQLIVMANSGDHDLGNRWFGSTAAQVARQADCPVLLVPGAVPFNSFSHITVATDVEDMDRSHLTFIKSLLLPFDGKASYVHININSELHSKPVITGRINGHGVVVQETAGRVEDGLLDYAFRNHSDLIVLIAQRRRAWQELFHRSCTKRLVQKCPLPILVLPAPKV